MGKLLLCLWFTRAFQASSLPPAPDELIRGTIAYHDPGGVLLTSTVRITVDESRVDGTSRKTTATVDYPRHRFELHRSMKNGTSVELSSDGDRVEARLDGSSDFSEEDAKRYRITPERVRWWRDIYHYLYGLPMKLVDPGTRLASAVERVRFAGKDVYALRVTYDPDVGNEIWYFYFDPDDYSLEGYRFYYDEAKGDGEYVVLDGEIESGGVRFSRRRRWYLNRDGSYYGTDTIESVQLNPK